MKRRFGILFFLVTVLVMLIWSTVVTAAPEHNCIFPAFVSTENEMSDAILCFNNSVVPGTYTINLTASISLTQVLPNIDNLTPDVSLILNGAGHTIDAQSIPGQPNLGILRIFKGVATIEDIELRNGIGSNGGGLYVSGLASATVNNSNFIDNSATNGGAIYNDGWLTLTSSKLFGNSTINFTNGGGIGNAGTLIVRDTILWDNSAGFGGGIFSHTEVEITNSIFLSNRAIYRGGGVLNGGTITVNDSLFSDNRASSVGSGIINYGTVTINDSEFADNKNGGIRNEGLLTVNNSIFSDNLAEYSGAGISNAKGGIATVHFSTFFGNLADAGAAISNSAVLTVANSTLTGNEAALNGGGISNSGTILVRASTLSDNSADMKGGGFWNDRDALATIANSTISDNSADEGGGLWNESRGVANLFNSTISGNLAISQGGGLLNDDRGNMYLQNVTIAYNSADQGGGIRARGFTYGRVYAGNTLFSLNSGGDCFGEIVLTGPNLNSDGSCLDFSSGDALLLPLADNGGATETHMLGDGSPAIDMGDDSVCADLGNVDQRGYTRVNVDGNGDGGVDGNPCDVGAVERNAPAPTAVQISSVQTFKSSRWLLIAGLSLLLLAITGVVGLDGRKVNQRR